MGNFLKFCKNIATSDLIKLENEQDTSFPEKYQVPVQSMIEIMKPKMDILDRISIAFIESQFEDMDSVKEILDKKGSDIPDGMLNYLAFELCKKSMNQCNQDEQSILKVLAIYIMLQN